MSTRYRRRPRPRRRVLRPPQLSQVWEHWAAENLLLGAPAEAIVTRLVARGVPKRLACTAVADLACSQATEAARPYVRSARRLELLVRLLDTLERQVRAPNLVERRTTPGPDEFFERYFAAHTPVIFTDLLDRSPARHAWTPERLRERFGDVEVRVVQGRDSDPQYDQHTPRLTRCMRLGEYVDRVLAAGVTNDLYMVANNRNVREQALASLFDDLALPDGWFDPALLPTSSALWFGPAGTVTPLHHDTSSILFCQMYGRKRWRLITPLAVGLYDHADSLYSRLDPEDPSSHGVLSRLPVRDVVLEPGEALFVPACYWHHVRALDVSISFATTAFAKPNNFDWFRPGEIT